MNKQDIKNYNLVNELIRADKLEYELIVTKQYKDVLFINIKDQTRCQTLTRLYFADMLQLWHGDNLRRLGLGFIEQYAKIYYLENIANGNFTISTADCAKMLIYIRRAINKYLADNQ